MQDATTGVDGYKYNKIFDRHFDGVNVQFADGHVKWLKRNVALYKPSDDLTTSVDPKWLWNLN